MGIPQGSVLSALLCCFFYGDLEKQFSEFREDPQSVGSSSIPQLRTSDVNSNDGIQELFRIIDDYLFITTSLSRARKFLDMMNRGMSILLLPFIRKALLKFRANRRASGLRMFYL